ncbi:M28 family peptidase [Pseudomonas oryzihabitans]|uniref:M28 family peptidase n=1 Tax=Pseudomonas oryzihabitans TaxID=47885 RepID=UPI002861BE72|nr:M28 family peptidase [Pseudomonas psychrotolerans]MDR6676235.1 Zn-dependent M28 family amino/carboxypeptidase [Pseudomonas psychrotolerans]
MRRSLPRKTKQKSTQAFAFRGYLKNKSHAAELAKHCRILSGALYAGRGSGEQGGWRTSRWIAEKVQAMGLIEWHGRRSLFQSISLGCSTFKPCADSLQMLTLADGTQLDLLPNDELLIRSQHASVVLDNSHLVFAGYGIVAQQYSWDDYSGLDVVGKVVVVLPNDPGGNRFSRERMTYYGRWEYKYEEAARQGAAGVIIIHTDDLFGSTFHLVKDEMRRPFRFLPGAIRSNLALECICCERLGRKLLSSAGIDLDVFLASPWPMANQHSALNTFLQVRFEFNIDIQHCRNVLAMKKGRLFPRQCILLCAHWDHLGRTPENNQSRGYYPGAVDNAIGVSVLIDLARRLLSAVPLRRTVLFTWTSAEEVGMLGSARVAQLVAETGLDVIAALNVDGFVPIGRTRDLSLVDGDQSDLSETFRRAGKCLNRHITLDDEPGSGYFYRSDQASFAKIGIPSVQISTGSNLFKGGIREGTKRHNFYDSNIYHRTSDAFNRHFDFESICADIDFLHETLLILGDSLYRPKLRHC